MKLFLAMQVPMKFHYFETIVETNNNHQNVLSFFGTKHMYQA